MNVIIMYSNFEPSPEHLDRLKHLLPDHNIVVADSEQKAVSAARNAQIILGHRYLRQTLPHAPDVEWIQSTAGGINNIINSELCSNKKILLTRAPVFSDVIAQHAFTMAQALIRKIPEIVTAQNQGKWTRNLEMLPYPEKAMVFGLGTIGLSLARLLKNNNIKVFGVAQSTSDEKNQICEQVFVDDCWTKYLFDIDLCFLALPLTNRTRNLFNREAVDALPEHAAIINTGRMETIDFYSIIEKLNSGKLGGAAMDVPDTNSWFNTSVSKTPGLIISPHVAVFNPDYRKRLETFIENQVNNYVQGISLLYPVLYEEILESCIQ